MTERTQLQPVEGLSRSSKIVAPPPKRRTPSAPVEAQAAEPAPAKVPAQRPTKTTKAPTLETKGFKRVTLSLPVAVVEALRERSARDKVPQVDVLMDALEATKDQLGVLLDDAGGERRSGLFVRSVPRPSESMTTLSLRMLGENLAVIDALAADLDAASRSRLCDVALRDYLSVR